MPAIADAAGRKRAATGPQIAPVTVVGSTHTTTHRSERALRVKSHARSTASVKEDRGGVSVSEADLRRWLLSLDKPARLPDAKLTKLLGSVGRLPTPATAAVVGEAIRGLLQQAIARLEPDADASPQQRMPYLVLHTRFVQGVKWASAAQQLGLSQRQLTREQNRAISLLRDEIASVVAVDRAPSLRLEPIPAISGYLTRPGVTRALAQLLVEHPLVHVHGPRGIGKTSLVADFASVHARRAPVFWFRFRAGVNTSLPALAFDLGEYLRAQGRPDLSGYLTGALPSPDVGIVSRLAIRDLSGLSDLVVLDDIHVADDEPAIAGFLEEAAIRVPDMRVITIGRHQAPPTRSGAAFPLPPLTRLETQALLAQLDVDADTMLARSVQDWTEGLPHLVTLAASWLKSAAPDEIASGIHHLGRQQEVQDFLLDAISELLDSADRAILDAASIFRDRFSDEGLAFVAEQTITAVEDASRRLVRRHLASRSRAGDVAFFHASIRQYFYERLTPGRRADMHRRAADWYDDHDATAEARHHRQRSAATGP